MSTRRRILVCLTATRKWYGKLIRWATRSRVNHSLVKHDDPFWGAWRATEIDERGPRDIDARYLARFDYIEHWESDLDLGIGMRAMGRFVGMARYDWRGLLVGLLRAVLLRVGGWEVDKAIHSHGRLFCSEFVAEVLKRSKVPGTEEWIPANVSPGDLRRFMKASPHFHQVDEPTEE